MNYIVGLKKERGLFMAYIWNDITEKKMHTCQAWSCCSHCLRLLALIMNVNLKAKHWGEAVGRQPRRKNKATVLDPTGVDYT
jgi:hypothetical protein